MKIAIVGGGQLARMLALAGTQLGMEFSFLLDAKDRHETQCIDGLGDTVLLDEYSDGGDLYEALGCPDLVTLEKEQIDVAVLEALNQYCPVYPSPDAFRLCSYRERQKSLLQQSGIPTAPFIYLPTGGELPRELEALGLPLVAKSTNHGYDGRNQFVLQDKQQLQAFYSQGRDGSWIVEQKIAFQREVSIVAARSVTGEMAFYPAVENHHRNGVLIYSISPAPAIPEQDWLSLVGYAKKIFQALDYVGVMAIECFVTPEGLMVNELAPRVHNSGHWTSNGARTCQFENHLRAVAGLPLGATDSVGYSAMVNLLGIDTPPLDLLGSRSSLHWYKKRGRPGRKVGHINLHNQSLHALYRDVDHIVDGIGLLDAG